MKKLILASIISSIAFGAMASNDNSIYLGADMGISANGSIGNDSADLENAYSLHAGVLHQINDFFAIGGRVTYQEYGEYSESENGWMFGTDWSQTYKISGEGFGFAVTPRFTPYENGFYIQPIVGIMFNSVDAKANGYWDNYNAKVTATGIKTGLEVGYIFHNFEVNAGYEYNDLGAIKNDYNVDATTSQFKLGMAYNFK